MSRGNWRAIFAALGIAALLGLLTAGYYQLEKADQPSYAEREYQPARSPGLAVTVEEAEIASKPYQPNCQSPKNREDADLCAQWAAVQAVEESNRLTRLAMRVNGLEIAAIVVTLIFTAWAAFAAASASRVAQKSLRLYQHAESSLLISGIETLRHGVVKIYFKNVGRLPAFVAHFDACLGGEAVKEFPLKASPYNFPSSVLIDVGGRYETEPLSIPLGSNPVRILAAVLFRDNVLGWQVSSMSIDYDVVHQSCRVALDVSFDIWMKEADKLNAHREKILS